MRAKNYLATACLSLVMVLSAASAVNSFVLLTSSKT
jgi:hypothetical protein